MPRQTPAWYDAQYNNRARVPEFPAILQHWSDASARAREGLAAQTMRSLTILFLVSLFATLSLYLIFRRHIETFAHTVRVGVFAKTAIGFVCVFMAPLLITILLVSILGFLVGLIVLCGFALLLTLALPLLAVTAGSHLSQLYSKKTTISIPDLILGAVAVSLCLVIPYLGYAVFAWLYMLTVGALIQRFYARAR